MNVSRCSSVSKSSEMQGVSSNDFASNQKIKEMEEKLKAVNARLQTMHPATHKRCREDRGAMEDLALRSQEEREAIAALVLMNLPKRRKIEPTSSSSKQADSNYSEKLAGKEELENEAKWFLVSDDGIAPMKESKFVLQEGENKMISDNGDVYEGERQGNRLHGQGRLLYCSGASYEGGFQHGLFHGRGKFTFPNGDVYEANFNRGTRLGFGTLTFVDGRVYKGLFPGIHHKELIDIC